MNKLLLVRGLPGSGKSTHARKVMEQHLEFVHLETDNFFITGSGEYKFDASKLGKAHAWCQAEAAYLMNRGYSLIISNTFSQKWEMTVYIFLAEAYNYEILETDLFDAGLDDAELFVRCVHKVPQNKIAEMRARWEK